MKLPHAELAVVQQDKIVGYLLNPAHRFGASKARFFRAPGSASKAGSNWRRRCSNMGGGTKWQELVRQVSESGMKWKANSSVRMVADGLCERCGKCTTMRLRLA